MPGLSTDTFAEVFQVPTSEYLSHETKVYLPYVFKKYFLFQRSTPKPKPLIATADEDYSPRKIRSDKA